MSKTKKDSAYWYGANVAEAFTNSESVSQALRGLLPIIQKQAEKVNQQ